AVFPIMTPFGAQRNFTSPFLPYTFPSTAVQTTGGPYVIRESGNICFLIFVSGLNAHNSPCCMPVGKYTIPSAELVGLITYSVPALEETLSNTLTSSVCGFKTVTSAFG